MHSEDESAGQPRFSPRNREAALPYQWTPRQDQQDSRSPPEGLQDSQNSPVHPVSRRDSQAARFLPEDLQGPQGSPLQLEPRQHSPPARFQRGLRPGPQASSSPCPSAFLCDASYS